MAIFIILNSTKKTESPFGGLRYCEIELYVYDLSDQ